MKTGLATSVSKLIEVAWAYIESLPKDRVRLKIRYAFGADKMLVKDYWKYTLPMLGDYLVWGVGFTMYSVIMGHMGTDAVAANSVANIVKNLIVSFCTGLANDGGIVIGNELGRGNLAQAKKNGNIVCKMAVISGILSGLLLLIVSPLILKVTVLSTQSAENLKWMLVLCACYMAAKSFNARSTAGLFRNFPMTGIRSASATST